MRVQSKPLIGCDIRLILSYHDVASSVDNQIASRWNLVALHVVMTRCYRFRMTWGWIINDRIFIFGWAIPLRITQLECYLQIEYHLIQTNFTFEVKKLTLLAKQTSCLSVVVNKHSLEMKDPWCTWAASVIAYFLYYIVGEKQNIWIHSIHKTVGEKYPDNAMGEDLWTTKSSKATDVQMTMTTWHM